MDKENLIIRIESRYKKLSDQEKSMLEVLIKKSTYEEIASVIDNYYIATNKFNIEDISKKEIFDRYLKDCNYPDYLNKLDKEAKENIIDTHNEIMLKCCGIQNRIYEPILEKLFFYFTEHNIPLWCMSGVLYYDMIKHTPVKPVRIIAEMGKFDEFTGLCREQYKLSQLFKRNHADYLKSVFRNK